MSWTATYTVWLTVAVKHPYYAGGRCGLELEPDPETASILSKSGVLFRKQTPSEWILIRPEGATIEAGISLVFLLRNTSPGFYFFTGDKATVSGNCACETVGKNGTWKQLTIPVTEQRLEAPEKLTIELETRAKFLEFIVVPRRRKEEPVLELREDRNRILFQPVKQVEFPSEERPVYRFVTTEPIALEEAQPYRIQLWEKRKSGENPLGMIPLPKVSSISLFSKQDTITSYFYF